MAWTGLGALRMGLVWEQARALLYPHYIFIISTTAAGSHPAPALPRGLNLHYATCLLSPDLIPNCPPTSPTLPGQDLYITRDGEQPWYAAYTRTPVASACCMTNPAAHAARAATLVVRYRALRWWRALDGVSSPLYAPPPSAPYVLYITGSPTVFLLVTSPAVMVARNRHHVVVTIYSYTTFLCPCTHNDAFTPAFAFFYYIATTAPHTMFIRDVPSALDDGHHNHPFRTRIQDPSGSSGSGSSPSISPQKPPPLPIKA